MRPNRRGLVTLLLVLFASTLLLGEFSPAYSISGPGTVGTTTSVNGNQDSPPETLVRSCSDGYTYYIWYDGTNDVYSSTNTPSSPSWSGKTTLLAAPYGVQGSAFGGLAFYCDASSNFYIAYSASSGHWSYRAGTLSGGVLTFGAAAVTLACANANCDPSSVYAFDTTHVWVGVAEIAHQGDVWACQTSACSTAGNWALSTSDSTATFYGGTAVIGLSTNQKVAAIFCYSACQIETTSNAGSSWSSPVTMPAGVRVSTHIYYLQCLGVSDTTYCGAAIDTASNFHPHLLSCAIGCGSWTDKNTTKTSSSITTVVLSTDGTGNFILAYQDKTTATTIDSVVTHNSGTSWTALTAITGEATLQPSADPSFQADPSYEVGAMALGWEAGASSPYNMRFALTDNGLSSTTVNLTCVQEPGSASATDTIALSGASVSPTTAACSTGSGTTTVVTATPSGTVTLTVGSASAGLAFRFAFNQTTKSITFPASGSQSNTVHDYLEDKTTASYSGSVLAAPIIHFTSSGNATTFTLGTGVHVLYHDQGAAWTIAKPTANFPSATERYDTNFANGSASANQVINPAFYHQWKPTIQLTPGVPNAWDGLGTYSEAVTGTQFGTASTTICTASLPHGTGTQSCVGFEDTGTTESAPASFASSVSGTWSAVGTHSWSITSAATQTATYNLGVTFTLSYAVSGGGSPTAPTLLCLQAGVPTNTSLTTTPTGYTCDVSTTWTVGHNPLGSGSLSSTERWFTAQALTGTVSSTSIVFTFYHQYGETASYSQTCAGGAVCTQAPVLTFTYLGTAGTLYTETQGSVLKWIDAGSTATITATITDTLGNVYKTGTTSWVISAANVIGNPSAYVLATVYSVCFHYILIGGGQYNAPIFNYIAPGGISSTLTLTTSQVCVSAIAGAWSVTNPLSGNSATVTQRAISGNTTSGTISGVLTETVVYWNQLYDQVGYTTTVPGASNNPTGMFVQEGQVTTFSLMQTPVKYWLDYNSHFSAQSPFTTMGMTIATLVGNPKQGLITNLDPIINYAPLSSCSGNPLNQMLNLCVAPAILLAWSAPEGLNIYLAFIIFGVNVAVYNKSQSIAMALIVLLVSGAVFGFVLPVQVGTFANICLYLGLAGLAVKLVLAARGSG